MNQMNSTLEQWKKANKIMANPIDELRLTKVKRSLKGYVGIWEIDCFFAEHPIKCADFY